MKTETSGQAAAARAGSTAPDTSARPDNVIPFRPRRGNGNMCNPADRMMLVMAMVGLSGVQRQVLAVLAYHCGVPWGCFAALETLCAECGDMRRSTLCRALEALERDGHIQRRRSPGRRRTLYHVPVLFGGSNSLPQETVQGEADPESNSLSRETVNSLPTETVNSLPPETQKEDKRENERNDDPCARQAQVLPDDGRTPEDGHNHHHRISQSSGAPCGAMAPVGAGHPAVDDTGSGVLTQRVAEWTEAGLETGSLTPDRVERIEGLSDTEWAQLIAYALKNDFLAGKSLDYITCRPAEFIKTMDKARKANPKPKKPAPPGASEAVKWWLSADRNTRKFAVIKLGIAYPESADLQDESPHIVAAWELLTALVAASDEDERQRIERAARRRTWEEAPSRG